LLAASAARRGGAAVDPRVVGGVIRIRGERPLSSIALGFGYATLIATGLLFVMHMLEGFNDNA
jgi:hypothetical protein